MHNLRNGSWSSWAAVVLPGFATAVTWPLTDALPFVNRVAIGVAVALVLYALVHYASEGSGYVAARRETHGAKSRTTRGE
jgi:hypothetical protein